MIGALGDLVEGKHFFDIVSDDIIYEVRYEIAQRTSNQIEVWRGAPIDSVFGHSTLSMRSTGLLRLSEKSG